MDEQAKVHHQKSKHRRNGTSRRRDSTNDTLTRRSKSPDDDASPAASNVATTSKESPKDGRQNDEPKIVLHDVGDDGETVQREATEESVTIQKGILGYMDREIKTLKKPQSLSDPTASPAQRSVRSRSSIEKSPRQKRSKSESRRRRERKLIAAGEMEVRQANETLMRYLKQCSEINDASLSGELEIDKSIDDRRVHRKTKSQRERRAHHASGIAGDAATPSKSLAGNSRNGNGVGHGETMSFMRDRIPPPGLCGILQELAADVVPNHGEIYNPFTPVVSPTDGPPMRTDKMFIQTPRGFRSVNDSMFYKSSMQDDPESHRSSVCTSGVNVSCIVQRVWILFSNICHGLLAGLALAHILFIITSKPIDLGDGSIKHYVAFAEVYTNTFFFLAIICMVSVFDRMDICRWSTEYRAIPFRWVIIVMIYMATIILSLSAESFDDQMSTTNVSTIAVQKEMESNRVINMWNSLSLARSFGAFVGWALVGMSPNDDLLIESLTEMDKYHLNNN